MNLAMNPENALEKIQADVNILCGEWPDISTPLHNIKTALSENLVFKKFGDHIIEISIVLADNDFIQSLNKTYRGKDKPTNVLSFPQDPGVEDEMINLGDVILAYQTVQAEAQNQKKSFDDHVAHLLVHGILHLLEYDHENEQEAEEMEALEIRILESLGIKNPYGDIVK
jgi:probable rRNA maturation factor